MLIRAAGRCTRFLSSAQRSKHVWQEEIMQMGLPGAGLGLCLIVYDSRENLLILFPGLGKHSPFLGIFDAHLGS